MIEGGVGQCNAPGERNAPSNTTSVPLRIHLQLMEEIEQPARVGGAYHFVMNHDRLKETIQVWSRCMRLTKLRYLVISVNDTNETNAHLGEEEGPQARG